MHHSPEERAAVRAMLRRSSVISIDDSGMQQRLGLTGFAGEQLDGIVRIQPFGLSSSPPIGAEGLIICPGGRSDRAMFIGGEHPQYRPKNTARGGTIVYDAFGDIVSIVEANIRVVHSAEISIEAPQVIIKGALTVTETFNVQNLSGSSVPATIDGAANFTGDVTAGGISMIHHLHSDVQSGPDNTGPATG